MIERPFFNVGLIEKPLRDVLRYLQECAASDPGMEIVETPLVLPEQAPNQVEGPDLYWSPACGSGTTVCMPATRWHDGVVLQDCHIVIARSSLPTHRWKNIQADEWEDDRLDGPHNSFEIWGNGSLLRRVVCEYSIDADGESWEEEGLPLPFETVERYRSGEVLGRLDRDLLVGYVRELGWDLAAQDLCRADGKPYLYRRIPGFVDLTPCPFCRLPLASRRAKQCLNCGADWHD